MRHTGPRWRKSCVCGFAGVFCISGPSCNSVEWGGNHVWCVRNYILDVCFRYTVQYPFTALESPPWPFIQQLTTCLWCTQISRYTSLFILFIETKIFSDSSPWCKRNDFPLIWEGNLGELYKIKNAPSGDLCLWLVHDIAHHRIWIKIACWCFMLHSPSTLIGIPVHSHLCSYAISQLCGSSA